MTWRLSHTGLHINQQSYGQSECQLSSNFLNFRSWPNSGILPVLPPLFVTATEHYRIHSEKKGTSTEVPFCIAKL